MFNNVYNDKRVLITGNTGFKGSWLSVWLHQLGAHVFGLSDRVPTQPSMFEALALDKFVQHHTADVRDIKSVVSVFQEVKPDFVFHLAAQPIVGVSYADPVQTIATNTLGTVHVLEAVRTFTHPCQVVLITSDKCYENVEWVFGYRETDRLGGKDIYSASKAAAEILIYAYIHSFFKNSPNVRIASVRAGNVIGGGDWAEKRLVPDAVRAWAAGKPVVIRNPQSTRPWQHVLEPLSGYLTTGQHLMTQQKLHGESFNFGPPSDQVYSVEQVLTGLSRYWAHDRLSSWFNVEQASFHEAGLLKLSCDKANAWLQWWPTLDFELTMSFSAEWYSRFYAHSENMLAYTVTQIDQYVGLAAQKGYSWIR